MSDTTACETCGNPSFGLKVCTACFLSRVAAPPFGQVWTSGNSYPDTAIYTPPSGTPSAPVERGCDYTTQREEDGIVVCGNEVISGGRCVIHVERGEPDKVREALIETLRDAPYIQSLADALGVSLADRPDTAPTFEESLADALLALRAAPSGEAERAPPLLPEMDVSINDLAWRVGVDVLGYLPNDPRIDELARWMNDSGTDLGRVVAALRYTQPAAPSGEALSGCCVHCGKPPLIEIGPVNSILVCNVKPACACGNTSFNLWPYPAAPQDGPQVSESFPLTLSDGSVVERIASEDDAPVFRRTKADALIAESYDWLACIIATDCGRDHDRLKAAALTPQPKETR